jgi:hypothetical protein
MIRTSLSLALATLTLSCGGSTSKTPTNNPVDPVAANRVDLTISSVTLADDCGSAPTTEPPEPEAPQASMQKPSADMSSAKAGASASMADEGERACEQSSVQLRVANGTAAASAIKIRKVELLDDSGKVLGELVARAPSLWVDDTYRPWDEQLAANKVLQVSYALSAPAVVRGGTYTVRVVIAAAGGERTIEQRTTLQAEASLPPGAVT